MTDSNKDRPFPIDQALRSYQNTTLRHPAFVTLGGKYPSVRSSYASVRDWSSVSVTEIGSCCHRPGRYSTRRAKILIWAPNIEIFESEYIKYCRANYAKKHTMPLCSWEGSFPGNDSLLTCTASPSSSRQSDASVWGTLETWGLPLVLVEFGSFLNLLARGSSLSVSDLFGGAVTDRSDKRDRLGWLEASDLTGTRRL